jgi:hypothetical protein
VRPANLLRITVVALCHKKFGRPCCSLYSDYATVWRIRGSNPGRDKSFFSSPKTSRPAQEFTRPPIQWVPGLKRRLLVLRLRMSGAIKSTFAHGTDQISLSSTTNCIVRAICEVHCTVFLHMIAATFRNISHLWPILSLHRHLNMFFHSYEIQSYTL